MNITEYDATVMQAQTFSQIGSTAQQITPQEMETRQLEWCSGLVAVSQAYQTGGDQDMTDAAEVMIRDLYDYTHGGSVFFRPTLTYGDTTFRVTYPSALSYFVGYANAKARCPELDPAYGPAGANDTGFAKGNWTTAVPESTKTPFEKYQIFGNIGITMGNVNFTSGSNAAVWVDKVFIFRKDSEGKLRIILHKSALSNPYPV